MFTAMSVLTRAVYGTMTKIMSNRVRTSSYTQAVLLPFSAAILSICLTPLIGGINLDFDGTTLIMMLLVIFGQGSGNVVFFAAVRHLTSGTAQIAFSSILVFNVLLSVMLLGLKLSLMNVLGIVLLMAGIMLVVSGKVEFNKKGVGLMMVSAFLFSIFQLATSQVSSRISGGTYLVLTYTGAAGVVLAVRGRKVLGEIIQSKNKSELVFVPFLTAVPSLLNFIFAYYAYRLAPEPTKVAMILTSQVVFAVLLGHVFLGEKSGLYRKLLAAVMVIVATVMIKG